MVICSRCQFRDKCALILRVIFPGSCILDRVEHITNMGMRKEFKWNPVAAFRSAALMLECLKKGEARR